MRTPPRKAMSTSIMLVMAAVVLLVLVLLLVRMLSGPAGQAQQTGEELAPLMDSTTCDIYCFMCCQGDKNKCDDLNPLRNPPCGCPNPNSAPCV